MAKRMLIDSTHPEETRVVVVSGNRLEEFDYETETKKQLKGNIYLAKVTRVEPSLQAAFVDYGGNRHGFLAFSEIHPDYYRIPIADREALIRAEQDAATHETEVDDIDEVGDEQAEGESRDPANGEDAVDTGDGADEDGDGAPEPALAEAVERADGASPNGAIETLDDEDARAIDRRRRASHRRYRIQEVVSRRQILLVQVVKEERGTKGAALTTYISLAGRYCVLMPNTPKGGGISRKITNVKDRKRFKSILDELDIPEGMAVIVRTAGAERTKAEIKRDYEYLIKTWDEIRERTLRSTAPALIHEEANLIKRSMRDLYTKEIDEILVDGDEGYRAAKDFMKTLSPSHAKKVKAYKDPSIPLFQRYQVEAQLDNIHSPVVQLKSGGYIVLNSTEALVAIDVNSGRATRERNIEETAYRTNLEAADEVARQLRLRDLAGLIVIDFIDMEDQRNRHNVERRLKEAMRNDRARIQIGRISAFGLLEMSRQRLRPSVVEASSSTCPHCGGTGVVRSTESTALAVLRAVEEEGTRRRAEEVAVFIPTQVALYILNQKRDMLATIESRHDFKVVVTNDDTLTPPDHRIEVTVARADAEPVEAKPGAGAPEAETEAGGEDGKGRRRGRRGGRRRKGSKDSESPSESRVEAASDEDSEQDDRPEQADRSEQLAEDGGQVSRSAGSDEDGERKGRRRGRRGGRRRSRREREDEAGPTAAQGSEDSSREFAADARSETEDEPVGESSGAEIGQDMPVTQVDVPASGEDVDIEAPEAKPEPVAAQPEAPAEEEEPETKPKRRRASRTKTAAAKADAGAEEASEDKPKKSPARKPAARSRRRKADAESETAPPADTPQPTAPPEAEEAAEPESVPEPAEAASADASTHPVNGDGRGANGAEEAQSEGNGETTTAEPPKRQKSARKRTGWWSFGR